jgi:hypothetical protein
MELLFGFLNSNEMAKNKAELFRKLFLENYTTNKTLLAHNKTLFQIFFGVKPCGRCVMTTIDQDLGTKIE